MARSKLQRRKAREAERLQAFLGSMAENKQKRNHEKSGWEPLRQVLDAPGLTKLPPNSPLAALDSYLYRLDKRNRADKVKFLRPLANMRGLRFADQEEFGRGLSWVARLNHCALRGLDSWKPRFKSARQQFLSLADHVFLRYRVPTYLRASVLDDDFQRMCWYVDVAQGLNIRRCNGLPVALTKKMAHVFLQACNRMPVNRAFRWAQVVGMGGSARLANRLAETPLADVNYGKHFWEAFVRFLVNYETEIPPPDVPLLVDYAQLQRYGLSESWRTHTGRWLNFQAQNPGFVMDRRKPSAMLRAAREWFDAIKAYGIRAKWEAPDYAPFRKADRGVTYRIEPLLTDAALIEEGQAMRHCVDSYVNDCLNRKASIWSLRAQTGGKSFKRLATVEVSSSGRIVQAQAKYNERPCDLSLALINEWADRERIVVLDDRKLGAGQ